MKEEIFEFEIGIESSRVCFYPNFLEEQMEKKILNEISNQNEFYWHLNEKEENRTVYKRSNEISIPKKATEALKQVAEELNQKFQVNLNTIMKNEEIEKNWSRKYKMFGVSEREPNTIIVVHLVPVEDLIFYDRKSNKEKGKLTRNCKGVTLISGVVSQHFYWQNNLCGKEKKNSLVFREDKLLCNFAFWDGKIFHEKGRINTNDMKICLERFYNELR